MDIIVAAKKTAFGQGKQFNNFLSLAIDAKLKNRNLMLYCMNKGIHTGERDGKEIGIIVQ